MGADTKKEKIRILQVSNISVTATKDQIFTMFQYIGRIEEMKVYPTDLNITSSTVSKCAFIKYDDERAVEVGQHLTNTVLIDRAIVCAPYLQSVIPDEATFTATGGPVTAGQRQLPPHVTNKVQELEDGSSVLLTVDPQMEALGLPSYPPLPGNTDMAKVEEIRRTIYVGNLPKGVDGQAVLDFFNSFVGEVMYLRMAVGPDTLPCAYAYIEFTNQTSVPIALQNNGIDYEGRPLRIQHSRVAIIKPQAKSADQALEEVEEAIRMGKNGRSRSRSPLRRRRTPSPSPRRKSRSPRRRRSRSRSKSRDRKRSRTRSRDRKRSRSRDRKRSPSRSRRRSRSRDRRRRSRSREKKRDRSRSRDRKKEKEREKEKKERKRSRSRDRKKEKESKRDRSSERKKDRDREKKDKEKSKETKVEDLDEETLRERLLEKAAVRSGKDGSDSDRESDVEKSDKDKTPSRIKNERKRRRSDSD